MKNIIYGLRSPLNDVYYYIGKSTIGNERALSHLIKSHSNRVNKWVNDLTNNWLYPLVDIIEEVENLTDLPDREKYWIGYYYNLNPGLLNIHLIPDNINETRTEKDEEKFNNLIYIITNVSNILKKERLARGLTQLELAKLCGISRDTISGLENDGHISLNTAVKCFLGLKGVDIKNNCIKQRARNVC